MMKLSLILLFTSQLALASPAQVLIIRHAEKPKDESNIGLSQKGFYRAQELIHYFKTQKRVNEYGAPAAIYAMKQRTSHSSIRAIQTVTPLAYALDLTVQTPYTRDETEALVDEIMNDQSLTGKMILICWEHDAIEDMVKNFGLTPKFEWESGDYDTVLKLDFYKNGRLKKFTQFKQEIEVE